MAEVSNDKPLISISVIGHVDSGKSTLTGRLATQFGGYNARLQEKLSKVAGENSKDSFSMAYFTDTTEQERKRGVTINTTLVEMQTDKFKINFLDCPGHADYIKNATSGCKQSDLSIAVVPANFQASVSTDGTLKTHLILSAILGSKNFIVCINKLDEVAKNSDLETTFLAACASVENILKKLGVKKESTIYLPISALNGTNVFKGGDKFPFFKGVKRSVNGEDIYIKTLEEAIDFQPAPSRPITKALRLPVSNVAHVPGHSAIFCGRIDYGTIKKGDMVKFLPTGLVSDVKNVQAHRKDVEVGYAGMNIGFNVNAKDKLQLDKIKNGAIVGPANDASFRFYNFYVAGCMSLKGSSKSGDDSSSGIKVGYTPVISCGTANIASKFVKFIDCVNKNGEKSEDPTFIPKDSKFKVIIYPTKPVLFEKFGEFPLLGKFVCRDSGKLVAVGNILETLSDEEAKEKYDITLASAIGGKDAAAAKGKGKKGAAAPAA